MDTCPFCAERVFEGARFCPSCGAALVERAAPSRVRKTVTIVFADLVGSTAMGERLDAESVRAVMSKYFDAMRLALERHGGTVEKFIGDAVMAVFGIPVLHEDDALRAVRASFDMRAALDKLNPDLEREWGVRVGNRIGVNTGEVVAGDVGAGGTLVTGDAVNVAARLEQAAAPGEILLGATTHRLVRRFVRAVLVSPLELKGKSMAVEAYRLQELLHSPEPERRLSSYLVGRDVERRRLLSEFEHATRNRRGRLVTVIGPAGVGKSRLVDETVAEMSRSARVFRGSCLSYGDGITFWPVAEVVREAAGIDEDDPPAGARLKLATMLGDDDESELVTRHLAALLRLTEEPSSADEMTWALRRMLQAVAARHPVVVVLDDIHWAESTLLGLITNVTRTATDAPLLLICSARPDLIDANPGWGDATPGSVILRVEPLSESDAGELVANLLGEAALAPEVRARIGVAAGGNPLFVEELVSMLVDDGLIHRRNGEWEAVQDLSSVSVPPTISALLATRLERLPREEHTVLEPAAVIGQVFYPRAVMALLSEAPQRTEVVFDALEQRDLIVRDESIFAGERALRFRHILIREAAYSALPKEKRASLHRGFADWLEATLGERLGEFEEISGYHLEQAYRNNVELRPANEQDREIARRASDRLRAAGRRALYASDIPAAANLLGRAAALLPEQDPERLALVPDLAFALIEMGRFEEAASTLAPALGEDASVAARVKAQAMIEQVRLWLMTEPDLATREGSETSRRSIDVLETEQDDLGLARAWLLVSELEWTRCQARAAEQAAVRAIEHARRAGDRRKEMEGLYSVALATSFGPAPANDALARFGDMYRLATGDPWIQGILLIHMSGMTAMLGRFDEARALYSRGRRNVEATGREVVVASTSQLACAFELLAGDAGAAADAIRADYEALARMGEKGYLSTNAALLARAVNELGRSDEALTLTEVSRGAAASDDVTTQVMWRGVRARVLAGRGESREAESLAREGVRLAELTDFLMLHGDALMDLAEVLRASARLQAAATAAEQARALYAAKENVVSAGAASDFIEKLRH